MESSDNRPFPGWEVVRNDHVNANVVIADLFVTGLNDTEVGKLLAKVNTFLG